MQYVIANACHSWGREAYHQPVVSLTLCSVLHHQLHPQCTCLGRGGGGEAREEVERQGRRWRGKGGGREAREEVDEGGMIKNREVGVREEDREVRVRVRLRG